MEGQWDESLGERRTWGYTYIGGIWGVRTWGIVNLRVGELGGWLGHDILEVGEPGECDNLEQYENLGVCNALGCWPSQILRGPH